LSIPAVVSVTGGVPKQVRHCGMGAITSYVSSQPFCALSKSLLIDSWEPRPQPAAGILICSALANDVNYLSIVPL